MAAVIRRLVACLLLTGVAAACGSDDSTSAQGQDPEASSTNDDGTSVETGDDVEVEILGSSRVSTSTTTGSDDADEDGAQRDSSTRSGQTGTGGNADTESGSDSRADSPVPTVVLSPELQAELDAVIQVSTTATQADSAELESRSTEIIEAWWFNSEDRSYEELADELVATDAVSLEFADQWRTQGSQIVENQSTSTEVLAIVPVRVEDDNATVQVTSTGTEGIESVSFFEFELEGRDWTLVEVVS